MGMFGKVLKVGAVGKLAQVVQREASKPENRKKVMDAVNNLKNRRSGGSARPPRA
jgi:hypothetical protein